MADLETLPMLGLDWRDAIEQLGCTRPELFRWIEEGKLPYDGRVHTYRFSSMSRSYHTVEGGWNPATIEQAKALVQSWRAEHKCKRSKRRADQTLRRESNASSGGRTIIDMEQT